MPLGRGRAKRSRAVAHYDSARSYLEQNNHAKAQAHMQRAVHYMAATMFGASGSDGEQSTWHSRTPREDHRRRSRSRSRSREGSRTVRHESPRTDGPDRPDRPDRHERARDRHEVRYTEDGKKRPLFYRVDGPKDRFTDFKVPLVNVWSINRLGMLQNVYEKLEPMEPGKTVHAEIKPIEGYINTSYGPLHEKCLVFEREFEHGYYFLITRNAIEVAGSMTRNVSAKRESNVSNPRKVQTEDEDEVQEVRPEDEQAYSADKFDIVQSTELAVLQRTEEHRRALWTKTPLYTMIGIHPDIMLANVWVRISNGWVSAYYHAEDQGRPQLVFDPKVFKKIDTKQRPVTVNRKGSVIPDLQYYVLYEHELEHKGKKLVTLTNVDTPGPTKFEKQTLMGWKEKYGPTVEVIDEPAVPKTQNMERKARDEKIRVNQEFDRLIADEKKMLEDHELTIKGIDDRINENMKLNGLVGTRRSRSRSP